MPNDPLFLMKPNYVLGNPAAPEDICPGDNINYTESIFEPYTDEKHTDGVIYFPIQYIDKTTGEIKEHNIEIRFSKVKKEFYDKTAVAGDPGGKPLGRYVKNWKEYQLYGQIEKLILDSSIFMKILISHNIGGGAAKLNLILFWMKRLE